jgi:2-oxoglutarate/2-oxoacid ferredoxin oxidoreductase subunit beta
MTAENNGHHPGSLSEPSDGSNGRAPGASLTRKDFATDQEVRWCPGCGDYAILNAVQNLFPALGIPKENFVVVSGIGCSSRFPYYMNTFGFHSIHGRAPAIATGIKLANPGLSVWIATGDGDALSIGGNHIIHALRRNVGIKILLFNNRIYGLTKGQASPTSEVGKKTKSSPFGTVEAPFNPLALALGAGATFVARSIDIFGPHLKGVLQAAAEHEGSAFVEIFQNCNIFNDGAWESWTDKAVRDDRVLSLEQGKPLLYGSDRRRAVRLNGFEPEVETFAGDPPADLPLWDPSRPEPALAFLLARLGDREGFPMPIGIFRRVDAPSYERSVHAQIQAEEKRKGAGDLEALLAAGESWVVP